MRVADRLSKAYVAVFLSNKKCFHLVFRRCLALLGGRRSPPQRRRVASTYGVHLTDSATTDGAGSDVVGYP